MAGSVNKVILVGNLGRDPEVRSTQDGLKIVNLSLATSESWRDKNSGERRERTEWHRVVIFNEKLGGGGGEIPEEGQQDLCRGRAPDPEMDRPGRTGALFDGGRAQRFRGEPTMLDGKGGGGPGGGGGGDMGEGFSERRRAGAVAAGAGIRPRYSVLERALVPPEPTNLRIGWSGLQLSRCSSSVPRDFTG